jgi:exosome complex component RRP41
MQQQEILELANLRIDGRQFNQIRRLKHKIGVLPNVDGSAYFEHGLNKVLALVVGPHEIKRRSDVTNDEKGFINCRVIYAPFSGKERKVRKPVSETSLPSFFRDVFFS